MCLKSEFFSIIVPIFNAERHLDRCILSIINQKYSAWELILVDDNSSDNSVLICEKYKKEYPDKIKIILSDKNEGQLSSRFKGVMSSNGNYILFLDADDSFSDNALYTISRELNINCTDIVSFNPNLINGQSIKKIDKFLQKRVINGTKNLLSEYLYKRIYGYSCFFAIKREIALGSFEDLQSFYDLRYTEDLIYMYGVYSRSCTCSQIPDALYNYYVSLNSASTKNDIKKYKDRFISLDFIYGNIDDGFLISKDVRLQIMFAILSYCRELCFVDDNATKDNLKFVRKSNLFRKYKKRVKFKDSLSNVLIKLLILKWYSLFIIIIKKYYKNHEKSN